MEKRVCYQCDRAAGVERGFLSHPSTGAITPEPRERKSSGLSEERRPDLETTWVSGTATLSNPQNCLEGLPLQSVQFSSTNIF